MRKDLKVGSKCPLGNYRAYLVRSLGTPDGLRAFAECIRSVAAFVICLLILSGKHPLPETIVRSVAAVCISKDLFKAVWR